MTAKKSNRPEQAREFLIQANKIKVDIENAEKSGESLKKKDLPPPPSNFPPSASESPAVAQTEKKEEKSKIEKINQNETKQKSQPAPASATVTAPVNSIKSSNSNSLRSELSFDALLSRLQSQVDSLTGEVKEILIAGRASPESKSLALQINRLKVRSQTDFDLVTAARKKNLPPPVFHYEKVKVKEEIKFDSIDENSIKMEIRAATDLKPAKESGLSPEDLNSFVVCKFELGDSESTFTTEVRKKSSAPQFNQENFFKIDGRSKATIRKIKAGKINFTLYHKRFLLSAIEIGHGDLKLKELANRAEIVEAVKLRGAEGRKAGEIQISVKVKKPFETPDIREVEREIIVVDEFFDSEEKKSEATQPPAVKVETSEVAAALPPGVSESDLVDPHQISDIFSNDALEAEIELIQAKLSQSSGNAEESQELRERLLQAQTQLTVLVTAVQNGNLSLDRYLEKLKESIKFGQSVAVALNQRGKKSDAILVLRRVNIMKKEVQTAEENRDQLEDE